jgi:hypothetical protein
LESSKEILMKKSPKKLALSRETLRKLTADQAKGALGGTNTPFCPPPPTSDSVHACCAEE